MRPTKELNLHTTTPLAEIASHYANSSLHACGLNVNHVCANVIKCELFSNLFPREAFHLAHWYSPAPRWADYTGFVKPGLLQSQVSPSLATIWS